MQEHIMRLAVEAGAKPWSGYLNNKPDQAFLIAFAQAVARECEALVMQSAKDNPVMGASACYGAAQAIRTRFGLEG